MPSRLAIRGPNITLPNGTAVRLRGFNLLFQLDTHFALPRAADTDGMLKQLLPGTNVVRLVMLHWDDRPTEAAGLSSENDCSEVQHAGRVIRQRCLEQFDEVLRWTASQGLWAILTARASLAAGETLQHNAADHVDEESSPSSKSGHTFFNSPELRERFIETWKTIAARYSSFDMIAGYELLSEPRVQPHEVPIEQVRQFYETVADAVQAIDPRTPIFVGPAPFYSRANLPGVLMPNRRNVVYNFNFFVPRTYVQHLDATLRYPGRMACCDLHDKDHRKCCPSAANGVDLSKLPCCAEPLLVDKAALDRELLDAIRFGEEHAVPLLVDQWGVQRGVDGRLEYLSDMLDVLEKHKLHWTDIRTSSFDIATAVTFRGAWFKA